VSSPTALELTNVAVRLPGDADFFISGVDLQVAAGEIVGLIGASGAGKTTIARAILGTLPRGATLAGQIRVAAARASSRCAVAYIDQDPAATLNPIRRVGGQVVEVLRRNAALSKPAAEAHARRLFEQLSLPAALLRAFPHQLSGGQQQRVAIARAMACHPAVVIADEPGSALDAVTQLEAIDAFLEWRREYGFGVLLISHDAALVGGLCDRVVRLEHGRIATALPLRLAAERCA
jgi:peptide/nickel transport system ATP-binding protein